MTVFCGVDAGGTHVSVVAGETENTLVSGRCDEPGRVQRGREGAAAAVIARAVRTVLHAPADALVVGAAGAGTPAVEAALTSALTSHDLARRIAVRGDGEIALADAFPKEPGMVLSAGTGSVAYATDGAGVVARVGGRGWRFGDAGGGYDLARTGIAAAVAAADDLGPPTALTVALSRAANCDTIFDAAARWQPDGPGEIALISRLVLETATGGDEVAMAIVEDGAARLAQLCSVLARRVPAAGTVAMNGRLLDPALGYRAAVERAVDAAAPDLTMTARPVQPAVGAWRLAGTLTASTPG